MKIMYLFLDNTAEQEIFLSSFAEGKWSEKAYKQNRASPKPLLFYVDKFLKNSGAALADLSGLAVLIGKGRFTSTRVAVTTANALAFALNIPVIGVSEKSYKDIEKKLKSSRRGVYVSAKYSGEANIGKPRPKQ